ncbi:MAG: hypothetical protein ACRDTH_03105 [Pseudonocardiaceae bacterium]
MNTVFGIPTHPFLGHLAAFAVPLVALLVVIIALIPRLPQRVRWATLALSVLAVVLTSVTESSGKALMHQVQKTALTKRHAQIGDELIPWVVGLFAVCVALLITNYWTRLRAGDRSGEPRPSSIISRRLLLVVRIILGLVALLVATGAIMQTVRIGHSGAEATWLSFEHVAGKWQRPLA